MSKADRAGPGAYDPGARYCVCCPMPAGPVPEGEANRLSYFNIHSGKGFFPRFVENENKVEKEAWLI